MFPILSYNGLLQALQTSRPSTNSCTFPSLSSAPALGLLVSCLNYPPSSDLNQFVNLLPLRHSTFSPWTNVPASSVHPEPSTLLFQAFTDTLKEAHAQERNYDGKNPTLGVAG